MKIDNDYSVTKYTVRIKCKTFNLTDTVCVCGRLHQPHYITREKILLKIPRWFHSKTKTIFNYKITPSSNICGGTICVHCTHFNGHSSKFVTSKNEKGREANKKKTFLVRRKRKLFSTPFVKFQKPSVRVYKV